jgi:hypothetical protein
MLTNEEFFDRCYNDFGFFYREFVWPTLNSTPYSEAPYVSDLLIEYATAFEARQIRKLLVAIPPRNGKTTLFTYALPVWGWLRQPRLNWATVSANDALLSEFYSNRDQILRAELYRVMFAARHGTEVNDFLADSVKVVENGLSGKIFQWTHLNTRTGLGADYIIVDDPTPVKHARNKLYNAKVEREFKLSTLSRRQDKEIGSESPTLVIQQRVAANDLIGCLKDSNDWEYLELQAIAEEKTIFNFPVSGRVWEREEGNVLNPERESFETLQGLRSDSVDGGFQAQYQQRPEHSEGAVIAEKDLTFYSKPQTEYAKIIMAVDCAGTIESYSSNWGFTVWGVTSGDKRMDLLFAHAKKYEYPEGKKKTVKFIKDWNVDETIIENKSTGVALIPELKDKCRIISHVPSKAHKNDRILEALPHMKLHMRFPNVLSNPTAVWFGLFSYEILSFPNCATDDLLDTATMAVMHVHPIGKKATNFNRFYGIG